jgi:PAS domain S-box-containing protein
MEAFSMESSNAIQQIMQTLAEGVAITDRRGQLVFANEALERLLGYEPGELVGRPWTTLFPERLHRRARTWPSRNPGGAADRFEATLLRKDGTAVPVITKSRHLSDGTLGPGTLSTFIDLREHHHLEAQVQQMETPAMMGQQVASIIHELSNSLTIVFLQAQLLSRETPLTPPLEQNLTVIQNQARRMMQMVDNLRATADPHQVNLAPTDINALIEQTLDLQRHQLETDGIEVTTDLEADLPAIGVDPDKMQQVFVNLINNARQAILATPHAGRLTIITRTTIEEADDTPMVQIRFADDGPGIPPKVMPHLFRPFFTTKSGIGMGLGLSICEQIVHKHHGHIWAQNSAGGGATFVVMLPVSSQQDWDALPSSDGHPRQRTATARPRCQAPTAHILIVDDEPAVVVALGQILLKEGFEVTAATDAQQALALLEQEEIDLIVSDIVMPHMNGQQFWQVVKERHPRLADRIIFSTGDSSGQKARAFLQARGCAWIEKPYNPEELLQLIYVTLPEPET